LGPKFEKNDIFFIKETIQNSPTTINVDDLQDFNSLCQVFGTRTPQSFRKVKLNFIFCFKEISL
jgi:hypothetical protein